MAIKKGTQLSFDLMCGVQLKNKKASISKNNTPNGVKNVVRPILKELKEKKKHEEAKIYGSVLSRLRHLAE